MKLTEMHEGDICLLRGRAVQVKAFRRTGENRGARWRVSCVDLATGERIDKVEPAKFERIQQEKKAS